MDLSPAQAALLDRLVAAIEKVEGVQAIWLAGSLASGEGDEVSDLDVHVAASPEEIGSALDRWAGVARSVGAVFARPRSGGNGILVNATTSDGMRFDIVVHGVKGIERSGEGAAVPLRDPGGLLARVPRLEGRPPATAQQVVAWIEEFLRSLLLLTVVAHRDEWIAAEQGSLWMLGLLTDLMLAENGESGAGSALRLSRRLTDEQRSIIQKLPALTPTRRSVVAFQLALAADFLPRARRLCERLGAEYPQEFEAAVRHRLSQSRDPPQVAAIATPAERTLPRSDSAARYDGIADWYDELFAGYGDLSDPVSSSSHLARLLGPGEGLCLDIACGGGLHHQAIASTGRGIVGIDLSGDQLRVARGRSLAALVRGSATALPFSDETFATAVCTYLHTDIDDMRPVIGEIRRVLRPGGRLVYLGVHPCFWGHFIENPLGPGRVVHPGYLEIGWIDSPFWRDPAGLRAKVGARHTTVSELLNAFIGFGLVLDHVEEPPSRTGHADRIAIVASRPATSAGVPPFVTAQTRR